VYHPTSTRENRSAAWVRRGVCSPNRIKRFSPTSSEITKI